MSRRLIIDKLARTTVGGDVEVLEFEPGVNVIVGPQNSGKSTWLRMLDYLMGETESVAERFDEVLVRKYRSVSATLRFGDEAAVLGRQWGEDGRRSQMTLDGNRFAIADVQTLFLERLGIPVLRYPQGNVVASDRMWPTLGWRSLLRHIYRRQDFWGDLVPQQPESEQHACLLQFLGLAEHLFADELATLVDKQKQLTRLQNRKDYFVEMMNQIALDLLGDQDVSVGITAQSIDAARARVQGEIADLIQARAVLLEGVRDRTAPPGGDLARLMEERMLALHRRDGLRATLEQVGDRARELERYASGLRQELERLDRADTAAAVFDDIKITHCPACDQSVEGRSRTLDHCFLCGQETLDAPASSEAPARRLKFERDQIATELVEADELVQTAKTEHIRKQAALEDADRRVRELESTLRPFQANASSILPEEVALIDQKIGALNARLEALERLHGPLQTRDALSAEIDALQAEVHRLEASLAAKEEKVEFETASDRLSEGFNTYLNAIRSRDKTSWTTGGAVSVRVMERRTQYVISGRAARPQLGGTLTIYFLFAYQYALISLNRFPECNYPGLTILDFFPDIANSVAIRDRLSLVLEPFVELARDEDMDPIQIIATTRDFPERPDVNLIQLTQIWR
jgi:hypothetical protein